jgi:hypothetical protein
MTRYKETPFEEDTPRSEANYNQMKRRIDREVVIIRSEENDVEEQQVCGDDCYVEEEATLHEEVAKRDKSLVQHIITGSLLTDGTVPYYRYFIAIAVMCFLSIFLTFLSLNAGNEYRRKERKVTTLYERSVLKEEQCYDLSSKSDITARLKQYNIELIDLSKDSRLIEK